MESSKIYLFYPPQNSDLAHEIKSQLRNYPLLWVENPDNEQLQQAQQQEKRLRVLALVSDDFLKNAQCMRASVWLSQEDIRPLLLPVLLHNKRAKADNPQEYEWQPTQIYTVPDTIHYRDFWYEEWIRLRKRFNICSEAEKPPLEADINLAKKLQPIMNIILGLYRDKQPISYLKLQNEAYQLFFERLHLEHIKNLSDIAEIEQQLNQPEPENPILEPENAVLEPEQAVLEPEQAVLEPENAVLEPEQAVLEPEQAILEPEQAVLEPEQAILEPENAVLEPEQAILEPENAVLEPEQAVLEHTESQPNLSPVNNQAMNADFNLNLADMPHDFDEKLVYENYQIAELGDLDVLFCLAETESEEGDFQNAKICYERILQLDPQNGRALIWLARLNHRFLNNPHAAEICYKKAILCSDESANLHYEYGLLLVEIGNHRRAVEQLQYCVEIEPEHPQAYMALAKSYQQQGQNELAKLHYLQAVALEPEWQNEKNDQLYKVIRKKTSEAEAQEPEPNNAFEEKLIADSKEERTVLITGATSGIGQAVAEIFALQGFKLIIAGRREEFLLRWQESLSQRFDARIYPLHIDVSDPLSVENAFLSLPEEFKKVDILINNAGLAKGFEPIHEGKLSHWNQMIDTNLRGVLHMVQKVSAEMVSRRAGHIINIGSAAAKQAYANGAVYCATKAAVDALTAAMRLDLYPHNVRVSAIHPGAVENTEFSLVRFEDEEKAKIYEQFKPLDAYDVAEMIYYISTRPPHVNIQEVLMFSTQQGSTYAFDKSGRDDR